MVTRVLQMGSAKGVARLLQRAGRSGHSPGQVSRLSLVPTNALELIESAAAQDAVAAGRIEPRWSPNKPLDVLAQHLVTVAAGPGFVASELFDEVRATRAYRELTEAEWQWVLDFVTERRSSRCTPSFGGCSPMPRACTGCPTNISPDVTGCRSARSFPIPRCRLPFRLADGS